MSIERHVLVGFDGSPSSERAVKWAVGEAVRRRVGVRLLYAVPRMMAGSWGYGTGMYELEFADIEKQATVLLERGQRYARDLAPGLEVTTQLVLDSPSHALVEWGVAADQIVVGARGRSPAATLLLGSVSRHTVTHAQTPVVVVRERRGGSVESGPVVVGLDGTRASSAALAYAVDAAIARGRTLVAVHAWQLLFDPTLGDHLAADETSTSEEEALRRLLAEELGPWRAAHPRLEVVDRVVRSHPVDELLELSRTAELMVLGSHGRNVLTRAVLGSVSAAVVTRAECPVAVLRPGSWPPTGQQESSTTV